MPELAQGQVWWANLPEPQGWRPVLILTRTEAIPDLLGVTVAPITRSIRNLVTQVVLDAAEGMPHTCAVSLDNIATVDRDLLTRFVAELSPERMDEVWEALFAAFDIVP